MVQGRCYTKRCFARVFKKRKISFSSLFFFFLLIILENIKKENKKEITDLYVTITIAIISVKIGKGHKC